MAVIIDEEKIKEVLERGVEKIFPNREQLAELLSSGKKIKLYCGFDPSAKSLHIGNAILLNKLRQFQELGHEVIFLIGDFTGMIGDPTDKKAVRKKMTREEVLANSENYQKQAMAYLDFDKDNPAKMRRNSEWQDKLSFNELLELCSHFTVQQMIQRDMFQERLKEESPIYLHEFLYPLAQAYDSVVLDVDLEIGGNDQMFNMLAGRDLMKALGKKEKFVLTLKLLADEQGQKIGKTTGNALFLDNEPNDMYGLVMSLSDGMIVPAFEFATKISWTEVKDIKQQLENPQVNPRDFKMKLAWEIVNMIHGKDLADKAQENFKATVQNKEIPDDIPEIKANGRSFFEVVDEYFSGQKSKTEIKRLFEQGGISLDGEKIIYYRALAKSGVCQAGKRNWFRIV